jgi:hypothetical protein
MFLVENVSCIVCVFGHDLSGTHSIVEFFEPFQNSIQVRIGGRRTVTEIDKRSAAHRWCNHATDTAIQGTVDIKPTISSVLNIREVSPDARGQCGGRPEKLQLASVD